LVQKLLQRWPKNHRLTDPIQFFIGEHQPFLFIFADKKLNGVGQTVIF